jgi:formylglycine-generating enzyme required for sulfatase activity
MISSLDAPECWVSDPMKNCQAMASSEKCHESGRFAPDSRAYPCAKRRSILALAVAIGALMLPARADVPASSTSFTVSGLGLEMRTIPAGIFVMGSPADEPGRGDDEGPQTKVTISKPFWLGRTDVTVGQWKNIMGSDLVAQARKVPFEIFGGMQQTVRDHLRSGPPR